MLVYLAGIDLFSSTLRRVANLIVAHRRAIGSRWRRLAPGRRALLALAHLRCGDNYPRLADAFRIGVAIVYRYIRKTVDLLAERQPSERRQCKCGCGQRVADARKFVNQDHYSVWLSRERFFGKNRRA